MKIANILGLYLGCKVKLKSGHIFTLHGVYKMNGMFKLNKRSTFNEPLKNCKLLLKNLDNITDSDKKELSDLIGTAVETIWLTHTGGVEFSDNSLQPYMALPSIGIALLASLGYDIGIVPKEYKEIVQ